ncbi:MAG: hypothetical protein CML66_07645 [Rhodobacteraceae bacterium]|nr:hypothetical protein [Paracoccaceae bacterium]MAY46122.1 hypothetical protein [Paracoccaceae bacterium]
MRHNLQRMWGLAVLMSWLAGAAMAGTLDETDTKFCDWRFSGAVEAGDLEAFGQVPPSATGVTLCLDSRGGDLTEGLAILQHVRSRYIRTRVLPGQICSGACALIFLGGSTVEGDGLLRFPQREIWAGARLGFSGAARSVDRTLDVAEGLFSIKVAEEQGDRLIEDHLYLQILRHRGADPYVIDTVGDAYMSNIPVMGVAAPEAFTTANIVNICDAVYLRYRLHDGTAGTLDSNFLSTAHSIANLRHARTKPVRAALRETEGGAVVQGYAGPYWAGSKYWQRECYVTIRKSDVAAYEGENAALGITGIAVEFRDYGGQDRDVTTFDPDSWQAATRLVGAYDVPPLLAYPFHARLDTLPAGPRAAAARAEGGPALPPPAPGFARFDGMDLAGGDLGRERASTGTECMSICQDTAGCDGATFDRWNGICFLKDISRSAHTLSQQPKSDVYVSGAQIDGILPARTKPVILRRAGKGFFDRPAFYFQGSSFEDCARQCLGETTCHAFNFIEETGACQVFDRPGEYYDRAGTEAGLKMQPL